MTRTTINLGVVNGTKGLSGLEKENANGLTKKILLGNMMVTLLINFI
jgi:hypothetical protein